MKRGLEGNAVASQRRDFLTPGLEVRSVVPDALRLIKPIPLPYLRSRAYDEHTEDLVAREYEQELERRNFLKKLLDFGKNAFSAIAGRNLGHLLTEDDGADWLELKLVLAHHREHLAAAAAAAVARSSSNGGPARSTMSAHPASAHGQAPRPLHTRADEDELLKRDLIERAYEEELARRGFLHAAIKIGKGLFKAFTSRELPGELGAAADDEADWRELKQVLAHHRASIYAAAAALGHGATVGGPGQAARVAKTPGGRMSANAQVAGGMPAHVSQPRLPGGAGLKTQERPRSLSELD